jgi:hypothetical protein
MGTDQVAGYCPECGSPNTLQLVIQLATEELKPLNGYRQRLSVLYRPTLVCEACDLYLWGKFLNGSTGECAMFEVPYPEEDTQELGDPDGGTDQQEEEEPADKRVRVSGSAQVPDS